MNVLTNLRIGFFGHSIAVRNSNDCQVEHFIDRIARITKSKIVNDGSILCSEERILYELKKHKNDIDLAVIFHSIPDFYFTPKVPKRDFQYVDKSHFDDKYKKIRNFDKEIVNKIFDQAHESFFKGTSLDRNDFINGLRYFNKYFYDMDLQINRYHGALTLIDQYLIYKKIPVVHSLPVNTNFIPKWFSFQSGIVEKGFQEYQTNQFREDNHLISSNCINQEGNDDIAVKLLILMVNAIKKVKT